MEREKPEGALAAEIGARIRTAREAKGLDQQALADAVGVKSWTTISRWENGHRMPRPTSFGRLASVLGVAEAWLHYGTEAHEEAAELPPDPMARAAVERPMPRVLRTLRVRTWLRQFLFDLQRAGATDDQITEAEDIVTAPELFTWYRGGRPAELSEEEALIEMEATAEVVWRRLERRGLRRPQ